MNGEAVGLLETSVGFTQALRAEGVERAGTQEFVKALSRLDPMNRDDIYWAGRLTLCSSPEDLPIFDRQFEVWFGKPGGATDQPQTFAISSVSALGGEVAEIGEESGTLFAASRAELLRRRDLESLNSDELELITQLFNSLTVKLPKRRTRRSDPWRRGELDVRAVMREHLRSAGEMSALRRRRPRNKLRRVVFLIDVSKSMTPYSDHLLRLAHHTRQRGAGAVETFTMGTQLTRVTKALGTPNPETALQRAGEVIPDWMGGTRIADGIGAFVDGWGRAGMARQSIVIIASDGWERGDVATLGACVEQLSRLAHRVIWMNPQCGKPGYEPIQAGIAAVLPHIDQMVAGHSLVAFAELLEAIADV